LSRLKRELQGAIGGLVEKNNNFHTEVKETLARLESRREEAERSTRHGVAFEDQLVGLLASESQRLGDVCEATGSSTGAIERCKVGDCVIALGPDSLAPGAQIVWEAKEQKSYDLKKALGELDVARKNRQAQIGVFVFSQKTAPEGMTAFGRYGDDIVIVWDADDPASDVFVRAAYSVCRALAIRQKAVAAKTGEAVEQIDLAIRAVEKHIKQLDEIENWASTARSAGDKILDRVKKMREALGDEVARLDKNLTALRSDG
jgi:hypothetical protein